MKKLKNNEILVLRTCGEGGKSHGGFVWPLEVGATATAPDWEDTDECGNGLHGLPWGEGGIYCNPSAPHWLVLRVDTSAGGYRHGTGEVTDKCKFKSCVIEAVFDVAKDATDLIRKYAPNGVVLNYSTNTGGDSSTNTGGHNSKNTGGHYSTNTGGYNSLNTGGEDSTNTGGHNSTSTGGHNSTSTGGDDSTNTGGDDSTNTGGHNSTNTGGYNSLNTGGHNSKNTGGHYSTNTGGDGSILTGGKRSVLIWRVWDGKAGRHRIHVAYVGEDGIEPNVPYRWEDGKAVRVDTTE